jgi:hypothetical protein
LKGEVERRPPFASPCHPAGIRRAYPQTMRWLTLYLAGYFMLLASAAWALWKAGILAEIPTVWIAVATLVAVCPALMLAVVSRRPATSTRS